MRFPISILILALAIPISLSAQKAKSGTAAPGPDSWQELLDEERYKEAHARCEGWLKHEDPVYRSAAHKCIANLVLIEGQQIVVEGDAWGGGIEDSFSPEAADSALYHLNVAMQLTPNDLSIHQGRLHLLTKAGLYDQTAAALEESFQIYRGEHVVDDWLSYPQQMFNSEAYESGLTFMLVLERQFPEDYRVVSNAGSFLTMLERDDEALAYMQRAVEMEPNDPINNWNLGRIYMYRNDHGQADQFYRRAMELNPEDTEMRCVYADFVEEKMGDMEGACEIRRTHCVEVYEERCGKKK